MFNIGCNSSFLNILYSFKASLESAKNCFFEQMDRS